MRTIIKNKRGLFDVVWLITFLLLMAIFSIIGKVILDEFDDATRADYVLANGSENTYALKALDDTADGYTNIDKGYLIVIGVLIISTVVSAIMIRTHPVFFAISIVLFIFLIIFAGALANIYSDFIDDEDINATATATFPITTHIMFNLPTWAAVFGFIFVISMYAKSRFL